VISIVLIDNITFISATELITWKGL